MENENVAPGPSNAIARADSARSEQILVRLQLLDSTLVFPSILMDGYDKSRDACQVSQQCENHIRPHRAAFSEDEMFFLGETGRT